MLINTNKAKELIIRFSKKVNINDIPPLHICGGDIERLTTCMFKLLGSVDSAGQSPTFCALQIHLLTYLLTYLYSLVHICHGTAMLHIFFKNFQSKCTALIFS